MNHGIECSCKGCNKIRLLLKESEKKGKIYLIGLEKHKKLIRKQKEGQEK